MPSIRSLAVVALATTLLTACAATGTTTGSAAAKSDAAYRALNTVRAEIRQGVAEPVPMHLRNAPTRLMKGMGYGAGYKHAHEFADAVTGMECLPPSLAGREFYQPTDRGLEKKIAERLREIRASKR